MINTIHALLIISTLFLVASVSLAQQQSFEQSLEGKTIPQKVETILALLEDQKKLDDPETRRTLFSMLIGMEELPRTASEIVMRKSVGPFLADLPSLLADPERPEFLMGTIAIRAIGEAANDHLEAVKQGLGSDNYETQLASLWAIKAMGVDSSKTVIQEAIDYVDRELEPGAEFNLKLAAMQLLESVGPDASASVPSLFRAAREDNLSVRSNALKALTRIVPTSNQELRMLLIEKIEASHYIERQRALEAIANWSCHDAQLMHAAEIAMNDPTKSVIPFAAYAYLNCGGDRESAFEVLRQSLNDESYRDDAMDILGRLGPAAEDFLPMLRAYLSDSEDGVREGAVLAVSKIGNGNASVQAALKRIAESDVDPLIRHYAREGCESSPETRSSSDSSNPQK